MSSFNGIHFKVQAVNTNWFPQPKLDDDGKYVYQCRAFFEEQSDKNKMAKMVSLVTWKRPLGVIGVIGHVEAGRGKARLSVPDRAGSRRNHVAVLIGMSDIQVYGALRRGGGQFLADLSFVLLSDPTTD